MVITYHGLQFFKVQQGNMLIAFNTPQKTNRFGATIGITSLNDTDFNGTENLSYGDKKPLVISGPGEIGFSTVAAIASQMFGDCAPPWFPRRRH